ncbi:ribosome assembly factor SBDS [Candidatus Micrarchaeota archaeon]|nr:ribosome assembly factor SBDS [Candidatus Micrarchaeota archaeon]MBU1165533.1 ribosome assembly factor SBDS [Candidatus Micrarchaeota archaeon]MBU1886524.1 ribosome assembly factor SBDS [Candidatus Micrarchaeota archaeon]
MVSLDKAIIASYEKGGKRFELYVDPDAAYAYLEKRKTDTKNMLVAEEVYADAKKGERAKGTDVEAVFGTSDVNTILDFILKNGEVQLTTEQKRKKTEERRKQIIAILLREAIDPRTKAPHTQIRLENALEEARIHVDPFKDAREQIEEIVKKLRPILPMKFEKKTIAVKIPAAFAHRCYGTIKSYGIRQEQWTKEGDLVVMVEIFAGMQGEFYDKVNKMTNGQVETKIIET